MGHHRVRRTTEGRRGQSLALGGDERDLRSVTANTRLDGEELFRLVARLPIAAHTTVVPFERVDRALSDLAHSRGSGSLVATVS